jgi:VWFA-related protein
MDILVFLCALCVSLAAFPAQEPAPAQIKVRTGEVVVDVSVTDSGGKPVRGLAAADFEVFEDGVPQRIGSFRAVSGTARGRQAPSVRSGQPESALEKPTDPHLISLVFDKIGTERGQAQRAAEAAREYIRKALRPEDLVAVFGVSSGIRMYRSFTADRDAALQAVSEALAGNTKLGGDVSDEIRTALASIPGNSDAEKIAAAYSEAAVGDPNGVVAGGGRPSARAGSMDLQILLSDLRMLLIFQSIDRQIRSDRNLAGLLSIVEAQRILRGRKCLVYFSTGFYLNAATIPRFRAVVGAANRAGVTIYGMDVAGMRDKDPDEDRQTAQAVISYGQRLPVPVGGRSPMDRVEEASGLNAQENLDELSIQTGGYTVKNTNDLVGGMVKIGEDLQDYYVLTYAPSNFTADGRFRTISVRTRRSGTKIRTRRGYYAFPDTDRMPLMSFEAELLEALNVKSPPARFPVQVSGCPFPSSGALRTSALMVQFPISRLKIEKSRDGRSYDAQADVMLIARNSEGAVEERISRQYNLEGAQERLEETLRKDLVIYSMVRLPPGAYSLEAVVRDRRAGTITVTKTSYSAPEVEAQALQLSGVVLSTGSVVAAESETAGQGPFRVKGVPVLPDLSPAYSKTRDAEVVVYVLIRPASTGSPVECLMEFLLAGVPDMKLRPALPEPEPNGVIRCVARVPIQEFRAGKYEVRVTVRDAAQSATSTSGFVVEP